MSRSPWPRAGQEFGRTLYLIALTLEETSIRGRRARIPWACGHEAETRTQNFPAYGGLILGSAAPSREENGGATPTASEPPPSINPLPAAASCAVASAKALPL